MALDSNCGDLSIRATRDNLVHQVPSGAQVRILSPSTFLVFCLIFRFILLNFVCMGCFGVLFLRDDKGEGSALFGLSLGLANVFSPSELLDCHCPR